MGTRLADRRAAKAIPTSIVGKFVSSNVVFVDTGCNQHGIETNSLCIAPYLVAHAAAANRAAAPGTGTRLAGRRAAQPHLLSPFRS